MGFDHAGESAGASQPSVPGRPADDRPRNGVYVCCGLWLVCVCVWCGFQCNMVAVLVCVWVATYAPSPPIFVGVSATATDERVFDSTAPCGL